MPKPRCCVCHGVITARQETEGVVYAVVPEEEGTSAENLTGGIVT